jgi:hypothetical protein
MIILISVFLDQYGENLTADDLNLLITNQKFIFFNLELKEEKPKEKDIETIEEDEEIEVDVKRLEANKILLC